MNARLALRPYPRNIRTVKLRYYPLLLVMLLPACSRSNELTAGGVYTTRSACPIVGIPAATGDMTLFNPPSSREAAAIDVTATITNVRATCHESADQIVSTATFDVFAIRSDASQPRQVILPYFDAAVQGGSQVVA